MFELTPFWRRDNDMSVWLGDYGFSGNHFKTDIEDNDKEIILTSDLPGLKKEDIEVKTNNNYITISAERCSDKDKCTTGYIRRERTCGRFSRTFNIVGIDKNKIKASYENGVLTLTLPKIEQEITAPSKIEIQ